MMISNSYSINSQFYWVKGFPSRDPITEDGGLNLYGFTYNDPINLFDILGREASSGKGGGTKPNVPKKTFDICNCVSFKAELVYRNLIFGKTFKENIFPPTSKPYKKKSWKCPRAWQIAIRLKPKGGFFNYYNGRDSCDKCAVWDGAAPSRGLGGGEDVLRYQPQVFFSGGQRGNSKPVLWGHHFGASKTYRTTTAYYDVREGDKSINVSVRVIDKTPNGELGGSRTCNFIKGDLGGSTLSLTY